MAIAAKASVTTEAAVLDRLIHFEVDDLFGQYSYKIPVNVAKRVTAIIAPNGSGKTICLRMIAALFAKQWSFFSDLEFGSARYIFESGKQVYVRREHAADERDPAVRLNFVVTILIPDHKPIQWRPGAGDVKTLRASSLESYLHFLTRRGPNLYVHDYSGERYTFYEAVEAFSNQLPPSFRQQIYGEEPAALRSLIRNTDCHLIETQRLLILKEESSDPYRERAQRSSLAISKKAQTLREIVARELAGYATLSQSLDRTFPKRVIELGQRSVLAPEDLKAKLAGLENKRASLMEAGILDSEADTPVTLPEGQLEDAISRSSVSMRAIQFQNSTSYRSFKRALSFSSSSYLNVSQQSPS